MRQAYNQEINIPQDLSVVGFDDIRLAQFMIPPLTTVQMSQTELAQIAFKALMNEVERESPSEGRIDYELNTHLVLRRSTALAPILDGRLKPLRITGTAKKTPNLAAAKR
jgi:LacI family transcriptional regulator, galactose operon repressor